jgi:hypothetical protein
MLTMTSAAGAQTLSPGQGTGCCPVLLCQLCDTHQQVHEWLTHLLSMRPDSTVL